MPMILHFGESPNGHFVVGAAGTAKAGARSLSLVERRANVTYMSLPRKRPWRAWWPRIVRFGFRLLYNELAWTYDSVSWLVSKGEWRKWQEAALPYIQGRQVLEIAHGPGHMLLALARAKRSVTGIDESAAMVRLAAQRTARAQHDVSVVRGRVQTLPFPEGAFDTVLSTFPTEFMGQRETMEAVHRVLRHDGRYVIVPEGHLTGDGPLDRFIAWLFAVTGQRDDVFAVDDEAYWPADSPRWRAFKQAMEDTGFKIDVHHIRLERSAATVIVARRDGS